MFTKQGWLALLWGIVFIPTGFAIQAIALLKTHTFPRWQGILFLTGVLLVGFPDGVEMIKSSASILMAVACVPYGIQIIAKALKPFALKGDRSGMILADAASVRSILKNEFD